LLSTGLSHHDELSEGVAETNGSLLGDSGTSQANQRAAG
jgi:hypothetical protein